MLGLINGTNHYLTMRAISVAHGIKEVLMKVQWWIKLTLNITDSPSTIEPHNLSDPTSFIQECLARVNILIQCVWKSLGWWCYWSSTYDIYSVTVTKNKWDSIDTKFTKICNLGYKYSFVKSAYRSQTFRMCFYW